MNIDTKLQHLNVDLDTATPEEVYNACKIATVIEQLQNRYEEILKILFEKGPLDSDDLEDYYSSTVEFLKENGFVTEIIQEHEPDRAALTRQGYRALNLTNAITESYRDC